MADTDKCYIICLAYCGTIVALLVAIQAQMVNKNSFSCEQFLYAMFFWVGIVLSCVSMIGVVAAILRLRHTLLGCMAAAVVLITILTFSLGASWMVVTFAKEEGNKNWWMVNKGNPDKWASVATCLSKAGLCQSAIKRDGAIFMGCCQYPNTAILDWDINVWENKTTALCYRCLSCMRAIFSMVEVDWKKGNISFTIMVVILWMLHIMEGYFYWKGGQMPPPRQQQPQEEQPPPLPQQQQQQRHEADFSNNESEEVILLAEVEMVIQGR